MRLAALLTGLIACPAWAGDLLFPVDCTLGEDCFIQQYVDRDPGSGVADFTCGPLTYNGHRGTDIRLADRAAMARGVDVLAATSGIVLGIRDGVPDHVPGEPGGPDITGRECGNGVLLQRADGWQFQYCHLANGSVGVRRGDAVDAGAVLGQIGLSGKTQFPHLHLTIRDQAGRVIDPFDSRQQDESCRLTDRRALWRTLDAQDYQPGGAMTAGFADRVPDYTEVRAGSASLRTLSRESAAVVFWVHLFGLRQDDRIELSILSPGGEELVDATHHMTRTRATEFRAIGRKKRTSWALGRYRGEARLVRDGAVIDRITAEIELR